MCASSAAASAPLRRRSVLPATSGMMVRPMRPEAPNMATFSMAGSFPQAREEALHAVEPGFLARVMVLARFLQRVFEFLQQVLLIAREVHGRLHHDATEQVAHRATAHRLDAFLAQAEYAARLRLGWHLDRGGAIERRHLDRPAQCRARKAHRDLAREVRTIALEDRVLADA